MMQGKVKLKVPESHKYLWEIQNRMYTFDVYIQYSIKRGKQ
jgi:hypothetical protein